MRRTNDCPHCEELRERIVWLESELGLQAATIVYGRLRTQMRLANTKVSRSQAAHLVAALYAAKGRPLTPWQLMEAIPSPSGRDDRDAKIVNVWVCFARRALGKDAIENVWGKGYQLSEAGMRRVAEILGDAPSQAAA